jgi:hypothetical protein
LPGHAPARAQRPNSKRISRREVTPPSVADLDNLCTEEADLLQSLDLTAEERAILRQRHRSTQQVAANISILCE